MDVSAWPSAADHTRTMIVGNGGAGKSWLARRLGASLGLSVIHLDDLRWQPGQYGVTRDNQIVLDDVTSAAKAGSWVMDGVYGWLAHAVFARITAWIWIDLPEDECIANVRARGLQGGGNPEAFEDMVRWIADYRLRDGTSCFAAHSRLFAAFGGPKVLLKSRADITAYADRFEPSS